MCVQVESSQTSAAGMTSHSRMAKNVAAWITTMVLGVGASATSLLEEPSLTLPPPLVEPEEQQVSEMRGWSYGTPLVQSLPGDAIILRHVAVCRSALRERI